MPSTTSACSSDCVRYKPKSGLASLDVTARLASTQAVSASEASDIRREIGVALNDLRGFDVQISRLRMHILALKNERVAFEECITDSKSLLSPIRKLPVELLTEIFSYCCAENKVIVRPVEDSENETKIQVPATTLLQVCRSWNTTVASTKALWASICLTVLSNPKNEEDSDRVQRSISRLLQASGEVPLKVTIDTKALDGNLHRSVLSLMSEATRWKEVSIAWRHPDVDQFWLPLKDNLPILERLSLNSFNSEASSGEEFAHAPRLRSISFQALNLGSTVALPFSQISFIELRAVYFKDALRTFCQAASLSHLVLYDPPNEPDETLADMTVHALPAASFQMIWKNHTSRPVVEHLSRLSFPGLQVFHLDDRNISEPAEDKLLVGTNLLSFLSSSCKTLHTLTLEHVTMREHDLIALFTMLPQLTTLHLLNTEEKKGITSHLIQRLHGYGNGGAQRVLLPKLADLEIDLASGGTFSSLLDMVRLRWLHDPETTKCSFASLRKVSLRIRDVRFDEALRVDLLALTKGGLSMSVRDSEGFVEDLY